MKSTASEGNYTNLNLSFGQYKYKKRDKETLSKQSLMRLFRRAGCKRISKACFKHARDALRAFLTHTIGQSNSICVASRRTTISLMDILYALKLTNIRSRI